MTGLTLLPIGTFATATQLSIKALQPFAEQGTMQPACIDTDTGYRFYRLDQVALARLTRQLRELDLSLAVARHQAQSG